MDFQVDKGGFLILGFVDEILDKTRVLATNELVISEGFRRELQRCFNEITEVLNGKKEA